jgi:hypothetical protein
MNHIQKIKDNRPELKIEQVGSSKLGNCYNAYYHKITTKRPISKHTISCLRESGFLGYGQEYFLYYKVGNERVSYFNEEFCRNNPSEFSEIDVEETDFRENVISISKEKVPSYIYEVDDRVDSSD